jgi:hypothetical protein
LDPWNALLRAISLIVPYHEVDLDSTFGSVAVPELGRTDPGGQSSYPGIIP